MTDDPRKEIVHHLPALRAFAISLTGNRSVADDVVQDTIVKAWTNFGQFQPGTNLRAWLFTILRNTFYSSRRKMRHETGEDCEKLIESFAVKPDHDGHLQLQEVLRALNTLPVEQREAIILVGASGFSYEEASDLCGVALGTIKSRVNRARARLTEILQIEDGPIEMTDAVTNSIVNGLR